MLHNVIEQIDRPAIQELLSLSIFPDPDKLAGVIQEYRSSEDLQLYGLVSENEVVGLVGYRRNAETEIEIKHIAVRPDCRGAGFGRGMILELLSQETPDRLVAETDEEAVDFYRRVGFEVESLGEKYPGVERFRCLYVV